MEREANLPNDIGVWTADGSWQGRIEASRDTRHLSIELSSDGERLVFSATERGEAIVLDRPLFELP